MKFKNRAPSAFEKRAFPMANYNPMTVPCKKRKKKKQLCTKNIQSEIRATNLINQTYRYPLAATVQLARISGRGFALKKF